MKKFVYLIPVLIFLVATMIGSRLFASGNISPQMLVLISVIIMGVMLLIRPKSSKPKPISGVEQKVRGEFAKDAFADDAQLNAKFQAALKDYSGNCPKAAISKLTKLAPLCRNDQETYAVSMAAAMCYCQVDKYRDAAREYTRALGLHSTSELAVTLGSCYQRLGQLEDALDTYEFALDLDPANLEARSILATAHVANGDYDTALEQALLALKQDEKHASSLATAAICYGLQNDALMQKHYTELAVENGYNQKKITDTISALKKK